MLLAAGEGTRLKPFTQILPKPLMPVMGVPCIQFLIDSLYGNGLKSFVVNQYHLAVVFQKHLAELDWHGCRYEISDESTQLLGSAGGLKQASTLLGHEPFLLMNADRLSIFDVHPFTAFHQKMRSKHGVDVTLWLHQDKNSPVKYREFQIDSKSPIVTRMGDLKAGSVFYSGVACIEPEALDHLPGGEPSDFVHDWLPPLIAKRKVAAFFDPTHRIQWLDIDTPQLWWEAHMKLLTALEKKKCPDVWKKRIEKNSVRVGAEAWMHRGSSMNVKRLKGPVYYGSKASSDCLVGPHAAIYGVLPEREQDYRFGVGLDGLWVGSMAFTGQTLTHAD